MKYTIALTLVTYLGCLGSLISIAHADNSLSGAISGLNIAGAEPIQTAGVKEFDHMIAAETKTYQTLVQEAEGLAQQLIQQAFQDGKVNTIVVRVVGNRFGEVAPILTVRVSRAEWQGQPKLQAWARYGGRSAMQLLGYLSPKPQFGGSGAITATSEITPPSESDSGLAPAPAIAPTAATSPTRRAVVFPGRESPIPGQIPESRDPGYR